jgi:type IV pilus assembly protein PilB
LNSDIGHMLVDAKVLTSAQIAEARKQMAASGETLDLSLQRLGFIKEKELLDFLGQKYNVPPIDLRDTLIEAGVLDLVPVEVASRFRVVPLRRQGRVLAVAMTNPTDIYAMDDIKFITGLEVQQYVSTEGMIKEAIARYYNNSTEALDKLFKDFEEEQVEVVEETEEAADPSALTENAPVVKLVNTIIAEAVRKRASDIHIEPYEKTLRVRYRIDGSLYEMMAPPHRMRGSITSRLKIMAELDIAEKRLPQDGNIKIRVHEKTIDLRVSSLPTIFGEKIVLRILDKGNLNMDLTAFGFDSAALKSIERSIRAPWGMVLVTGPTGSGKTTTLYSALSAINSPEANIITAEDPVEYNLEGINQVNMHEAIGLTFATSLRAFLRQDPNIIMVGEIRDLETAAIAVKAALTGHLVLSTLHTNDAPSTISRLIDMGIQPFLVASSVKLIVAQRLVRRVCGQCKERVDNHPEVLDELGLTAKDRQEIAFFRGKGCERCAGTGYAGRQGLYEVMPVSPAISRMILDHKPIDEIKRKAEEEGMMTLRADGIRNIRKGITTVEDVIRETSNY